MEEKTYGVKIVALTDGFKNKINEIKNITKSATDKIKQNFENMKQKTSQNLVPSETIVRIQQLKSEIRTLKSEMNSLDPKDDAFKEYAWAIDDAEKELKQLTSQQNKAVATTNSLNTTTKKMKNTSNLFQKLTRKVTRYGFALLSVRGIIALISRTSSAYLAQDIDLANKLQSVWAGMGAFLAPILDAIATKLMKLVKYLNIFVKAVTGQDLLAKASKKATSRIKDQTKATKSLNKALSSIDEITNIGMDQNTGTGVGDIENPFKNFDDVKIDTGWADKIRQFGEWVKNNWQMIVAGITGIALAIGGLKFAMTGGEFAVFGRVLAGIGLAIYGVVGAFQSFKSYLELTNQGLADSQEGWKKFWDIIKYVGIAVVGIGIAFGSLPVVIGGAIVTLIGIIAKHWETIKKGINSGVEWIVAKTKWLFGDTIGDMIIAPFVDAVDIIVWTFDGLFRGIKQILDGILDMFKGDFKKGLLKAGKGIANGLIGMLNGLISGLNLINAPLRAVIVGIGKATGKNISMSKVKIPKIPYLATGTNYVPEDQLAYIHKGEAVVPKKFNSAEYFNNVNNNKETNSLLMDVNRNLLELIDKDTNLYINGRELAQSTYKDFENEKNRLGSSSVVVRR